MANCEYLLKMIDKANNGSTFYGTSGYATKQVIDTTAVSNAIKLVLNGKFVAVGGYYIAYSYDGKNWNSKQVGKNNWTDIAYGNNLSGDNQFVAVSDGGSYAYSYDGINWTVKHSELSIKFVGIAYSNKYKSFVALGNNGAGGWAAPETGFAFPLPTLSKWDEIIYDANNDVFKAFNYEGPVAISGDNGRHWYMSDEWYQKKEWKKTAFGNGVHVRIRNSYSPYYGGAAYSYDGINWNETTGWSSVIYGGE